MNGPNTTGLDSWADRVFKDLVDDNDLDPPTASELNDTLMRGLGAEFPLEVPAEIQPLQGMRYCHTHGQVNSQRQGEGCQDISTNSVSVDECHLVALYIVTDPQS